MNLREKDKNLEGGVGDLKEFWFTLNLLKPFLGKTHKTCRRIMLEPSIILQQPQLAIGHITILNFLSSSVDKDVERPYHTGDCDNMESYRAQHPPSLH